MAVRLPIVNRHTSIMNPVGNPTCAARHFCALPGRPLGDPTKPHIPHSHRCINCDLPMHSVLCGHLMFPEEGEESRAIVDVSRLCIDARERISNPHPNLMICGLCYDLISGPLHPQESDSNEGNSNEGVSMEADTGTALTPAGRVSNKLIDVDLCAIYNLSHVVATPSKTNLHTRKSKKKKNQPSKPEELTRLKSFLKENEDGTINSTHTPEDLKLDSLRAFACKLKVKGYRTMNKECICEAIVGVKVEQDKRLATGVGEVLDENNGNLRINRKRMLNVLGSRRFFPYFLKIGNVLSGDDLTEGLAGGEEAFTEFISLYNIVDDEEFKKDQFPHHEFDMDAGDFQQLPDSWWKKCFQEFKTLGKEYEEADAWAHKSGEHNDFVDRLYTGEYNNPSMIYLHRVIDGNMDLLKILTVELPDNVFAQLGRKRNKSGSSGGPKKKQTKSKNGKGPTKSVGRSFLPQNVADSISMRNETQAKKLVTEMIGSARTQLQAAELEHQNHFNAFITHCKSKGLTHGDVIQRIKDVKEKCKDGKRLVSFGYESDASDDDDEFPDSQEVNIKSILTANKRMKDARTHYNNALKDIQK